jgi:hypothetical protein
MSFGFLRRLGGPLLGAAACCLTIGVATAVAGSGGVVSSTWAR